MILMVYLSLASWVSVKTSFKRYLLLPWDRPVIYLSLDMAALSSV